MDTEFYCYRCRRFKKLTLKSQQHSPSGKPMCTTCEGTDHQGISVTHAPHRLKKKNTDYLASLYKNK